MSRVTLLGVLLCALLLSACASPERVALDTPEARLFTSLHAGEVAVASIEFDDTQEAALIDLARAECPGDLPSQFTRTVITGGDDALVIYTAPDAAVPSCMVYKPAPVPEIVQHTPQEAPAPEIALTVNGEPILYETIKARLALTAVNTSDQMDAVVTALLDEALLRQAAVGIEPTPEELAATRDANIAAFGTTLEGLDAALAAAGMDRASFDVQVRDATAISLLLRDRLLLDEVNVTEEDAKAVYLADPNRFLRSEQAVMRAIYIASDGRTLAEADRIAQDIAARVPTEDFCALVRAYSEDAKTKETCGTYLIPRGVVDSRLEAAAFGTPTNKTAVVVTDAGVYFVQTLQVLPASIVPYPDVSETLRARLRDQIVQERLLLYLAILRSRAEIVSYLG